jgi:hypothetical protein
MPTDPAVVQANAETARLEAERKRLQAQLAVAQAQADLTAQRTGSPAAQALKDIKAEQDIVTALKSMFPSLPAGAVPNGQLTISDIATAQTDALVTAAIGSAAEKIVDQIAKRSPAGIVFIDSAHVQALMAVRTFELALAHLAGRFDAIATPDPRMASDVGLLASAGVVTTGADLLLRAAAGLVSLFKSDVELKSSEFAKAQAELETFVAGKLTAQGIAVRLPSVIPAGFGGLAFEASALGQAFNRAHRASTSARRRIDAKPAPTNDVEKVSLAALESAFSAAEQALQAVDAGVSAMSTTDQRTLLQGAAMIEWMGPGVLLLQLTSIKAGVTAQISKSLWHNAQMTVDARAIAAYTLFDAGGQVVGANVVSTDGAPRRLST